MAQIDINKMLKLVNDPRATTQQLNTAMNMLTAQMAADAEAARLNPPPPMPTPEERLLASRRAAQANLAKRYKR